MGQHRKTDQPPQQLPLTVANVVSPNSIEYAHFYANLLFKVSNEAKEYEEVISECERALAVENPNDPKMDELRGTETADAATAEEKDARVLHVRSELRGLIQKANIALISSWMKNLGGIDGGGEKFRLIPVKQRTAVGGGSCGSWGAKTVWKFSTQCQHFRKEKSASRDTRAPKATGE